MTKTKSGDFISCVVTVRKCFAIGQKENQRDCLLEFPLVWWKPCDHVTDCYCCMMNTRVVGKKNRHKISYPSIRPVQHFEELPVPVFVVFPRVKTVMRIRGSMRSAIKR